MQDHREISWQDTVDPPARNAGELEYKEVSRDPERTPFQWDNSSNAGMLERKMLSIFLQLLLSSFYFHHRFL